MTMTARYELDTGRFRIEGTCCGPDADSLGDAVARAGREHHHLLIDLTCTEFISADVASLLVQARVDAEHDGRRIVLLRRSDSQVDHALITARDMLVHASPITTNRWDQRPAGG